MPRGGKREGAGRPKGTTKDISNARKQHQVRAFDDEWELIRRFIKQVRKNKNKCEQLLKTLEDK